MNESKISWTNKTWNFVHGCSKVSDGCKYCYAMTLSLKNGWTSKPWTVQHEAENVLIKPHKLHEPFTLSDPQRIFVNSMSDAFHRSVPDWYLAAGFAVMLSLPQHIFQILTKRPELTTDWPDRYSAAVRSREFMRFANSVKNRNVQGALANAASHKTPWASHIWMGTSVEDARVIDRISAIQLSTAAVKFISAEPLLGCWSDSGDIDLTGIDWVIVGGESGPHMKQGNPRWMKQEWARHIRDICVRSGVAYFYKQDSGHRTELRTYLVHEDGSKWRWHQYPGYLAPPTCLDDLTRQYNASSGSRARNNNPKTG